MVRCRVPAAGVRPMYGQGPGSDMKLSAASRACTTWNSTRPIRIFLPGNACIPDDPLGPVSQAAGYLFGEFARLDILESQLFTNDKTFESRAKLAPDPKVRDEFNGAVRPGQSACGRCA